jgi:hypothetical protein
MSHDDSTGSGALRERPWAQVLLVSATLTALGALGWVLWQGLAHPNRNPTRTRIGDVALASDVGKSCGEHDQLTIRVIHSPDKSAWMQRGVEAFMRRCPNTQVELRPLDDVAAIDSLSYDAARPTLWVPSDGVAVDLLPPLAGLERGPSLLRSPLVVMLWSDRLEALEQLRPGGFERLDAWASLACALPPDEVEEPQARADMHPRAWAEWWVQAFGAPPREPPSVPTREQLEQWGNVDFLHASPSHDVAGLATLALMAYGRLGHDELEDDELVEAIESGHAALEPWIARCEAGGVPPELSERRLADRLHWFGPTGPDGTFVYEHSAIEVLRRQEESSEGLRVVTPATTIVADHPAVYLVRAEEPAGEAARQLVEFLRGPEPQVWAIEAGFRPASPDVEIRHARTESNPFVELRRFGITLDLEVREAPALDLDLLVALREGWQDATGRE